MAVTKALSALGPLQLWGRKASHLRRGGTTEEQMSPKDHWGQEAESTSSVGPSLGAPTGSAYSSQKEWLRTGGRAPSPDLGAER